MTRAGRARRRTLGRRDAQTAAPLQVSGAGNQVPGNPTCVVEDQDRGPTSRHPGSWFPDPWLLNVQKGGDPAAGSPTATLLRLHPSR
jgi:hypothetical protein